MQISISAIQIFNIFNDITVATRPISARHEISASVWFNLQRAIQINGKNNHLCHLFLTILLSCNLIYFVINWPKIKKAKPIVR